MFSEFAWSIFCVRDFVLHFVGSALRMGFDAKPTKTGAEQSRTRYIIQQ